MSEAHGPGPHISVVIPVYQAADCLHELHRRLSASLRSVSSSYEIVMVEDGGRDRSWEVIVELAGIDPRVKGIQLSRNFGQHYAITAGLDSSRGDWVVVMDCDLQDQPEEIRKLYDEARKGYDIVFARRANRQDGLGKRVGSAAFYLVLNYLTDERFDPRVSGFCILSRSATDAVCSMREATRWLMALVHWVGFETSSVMVEHGARHSGSGTYTLGKLLRLALNTSIAYSDKPLRIAISLGAGISVLAMASATYIYALAALEGTVVEGWASLMVSVWFLSGLIIANLGVIGLYLSRVFDQTRQRPLYLIKRRTPESPGGD